MLIKEIELYITCLISELKLAALIQIYCGNIWE